MRWHHYVPVTQQDGNSNSHNHLQTNSRNLLI